MAKQIITTITDDLSGDPDASQVTFAFEGVEYSIDLAAKNLDKMTKALQPFIDKATKVTRSTSAARSQSAKQERPYDIVQLREWAGRNKVQLPARGRIPRSTVESYLAAGGR